MIADCMPVIPSRHIEANNRVTSILERILMVRLNNFVRYLLIAKLCHIFSKLIIKDIGKPFVENKGENKVFEFWWVCGPTNSTSRIQKPRFKGWHVEMFFVRRHEWYRRLHRTFL